MWEKYFSSEQIFIGDDNQIKNILRKKKGSDKLQEYLSKLYINDLKELKKKFQQLNGRS